MKTPLQKIEELISVFPKKDSELANKFFKNRDFNSILELVESNLYMIDKNKSSEDFTVSDKELQLGELKCELISYISCLTVPDEYDY